MFTLLSSVKVTVLEARALLIYKCLPPCDGQISLHHTPVSGSADGDGHVASHFALVVRRALVTTAVSESMEV